VIGSSKAGFNHLIGTDDTDSAAKQNGSESGNPKLLAAKDAEVTKAENAKTLPLITLITRISTDRTNKNGLPKEPV
jgi:hypothetical protein